VSETVLVVDDRDANLELIEGYLQEVGCEVVTATTGVEALRMIASQPPDLVLLDVMMPGLDGFDVCRQIKGRTHLLPVVLVTALSQSLDRVPRARCGRGRLHNQAGGSGSNWSRAFVSSCG